MPVTFHKQIKSSGYSGAPTALKYSATQKQKVAQQQSAPSFEVSRDFFSKPLPMTVPNDCAALASNQLHRNSVVRLAYSPSGTKLAAAS